MTWRGTPLARLDGRTRARTVAYLPQDPPVHWPLAARELVALGRLPHRAYGADRSAADAAAVTAAMRANRYARVRGAQREPALRRRAGARAARARPRRRSSGAARRRADRDARPVPSARRACGTLRAYATGRRRGLEPRLVVVVLHDLGLAARFCDRVLLMDGGAIVGDGPPDATLERGRRSARTIASSRSLRATKASR